MQTGTTLRNVEEGMKVFDRDQREIGKVEYVQFGDDDPETIEVESASPSRPPPRAVPSSLVMTSPVTPARLPKIST